MREYLETSAAVVATFTFAALGAATLLALALIPLAARALPFAVGIWVLHKLMGFPF